MTQQHEFAGEPAPRAPRAPRVWTVALACAVTFTGIAMLAVVALLVVTLAHPQRPVPDATASLFSTLPGLLAMAGASTAWILFVALVAGRASPEPLLFRLGLVAPRLRHAATWVVAIAGGLALSQAIDFALRLSGVGRGISLEQMIAILRQASGPWLAVTVLVVGLGAGVAEELLFRGYVQRRLVARFGDVAGVASAAALFALAHFDPQHSAFAFVFGLYLGAVALWTGSTWPAIAIHVVNNVTSVLLVAARLDDAAMDAPRLVLLGLVAGLAGLAIGAMTWVRRRG
ncbi:MAG: type II CAAX endopeptidase family protein [Candidatus Eisenbacteria bacterium]